VRREIEAISRSISVADVDKASALRRRKVNLALRLKAVPSISQNKLRRFREKIEKRARLKEGRLVLTAMDNAIRERWHDVVGAAMPEEWIQDRGILSLFGALLSLPDGFRDLAIRILRVRLGPPPWDLREEPRNREFLEAMGRRGIVMDPWIDGIGSRAYVAT